MEDINIQRLTNYMPIRSKIKNYSNTINILFFNFLFAGNLKINTIGDYIWEKSNKNVLEKATHSGLRFLFVKI